MELLSAVGNGGSNRPEDVIIVQALLAEKLGTNLVQDGICGYKTQTAILRIQSRLMPHPDGRIDPGGRTWRYLSRVSLEAATPVSAQNAKRHINLAGLIVIKFCESLRLDSYVCPAGVLTIGWGHTGSDVIAGMSITQVEAEVLLRSDLEKFEKAVQELVKVDLNDNEFSALVSFVFNVGKGNFKQSTLLKKLNESDYTSAANEFQKWNKGNGSVLPGLVTRRNMERSLFVKPN